MSQVPDLIHGSSAEQAQPAPTPSEVESRKAKTFETTPVHPAKDKDLRTLVLIQTELAGLSEACGWAALSSDTASFQAKMGGIEAGLLRVQQRIAAMAKTP